MEKHLPLDPKPCGGSFEALFGVAQGAAAGGGSAAQQANQLRAPGRSATAQGFSGAQATGLEAFYAQAQANIAASTSSVTGIWPAWMRTVQEPKVVYVTGERMRRINQRAHGGRFESEKEIRADRVDSSAENAMATVGTQAEAAADPGAYKPVELEAHEDFAVKLSERPKKK